MARLVALLAFWPLLAAAAPVYEKDDFKVMVNGHLQYLLTSADDPYYSLKSIDTPAGPIVKPVPGHSTGNAVRGRAICRVLTGTRLSAELDLDATYTFGSALDSLLFQMEKDREPPTFFNWQREWIDEDGRYGKLSIYRALLTYEAEKYRVILGRQRLAYGAGLFWSPIDIWNPVSPLAIEPEEKVGVDGVSAIYWPNDQLSATALYGFGDNWDDTRVAASVSYRLESYTFDFLMGKLFRDLVYGVSFVGYLGQAGLRGELVYTAADQRDDFIRGVIGLDYALENSLYLALELYHNSGPIKLDPADPFETIFTATGVDSINRNFLGAMLTYQLDPLIAFQAATIIDLDRGSEAIAPALVYNLADSLTISGGAQFFRGARSGEYGLNEDQGWLRVRYDF